MEKERLNSSTKNPQIPIKEKHVRKRRPISERRTPLAISIDELVCISSLANILYDKFIDWFMHNKYIRTSYITDNSIDGIINRDTTPTDF